MAKPAGSKKRSDSYDSRKLGDFVQTLRQRRGQSLGELARDADIAKQALSNLEKGSVVPSLLTLAALAEVLRVDLIDLVRVGQHSPEKQPKSSVYALVPMLEQLDDFQLDVVHAQLRGMLGLTKTTSAARRQSKFQ
ncbi:MAG TPA: helix-turn-helix transcriptional regulator [Hyphomonadaceae bacterium]|nr:helix-turn-helix transcriptional regulator [Hyphomonadaceae bacterium]